MDADQILEHIKTAIGAKFAGWNVHIHNPFRDKVKTPAMLIECEAGNPTDIFGGGDGRIWVGLDLSVKVVLGNLDKTATALQATNICVALSQFISGQTWGGISEAKPAEWRGFVAEPFISELDHLAYWSVNWSQEFLLGDPDPIEVDAVDQIHLGISPTTGPENRNQYTDETDG